MPDRAEFYSLYTAYTHGSISIVKQLESSLVEFGHPWKLNPGDGAFYGPKVSFIWKLKSD